MVTLGEKYVERASKAIVETAILAELRTRGPMERGALSRRILADGRFPGGVDEAFVDKCLSRIERDKHVERDGAAYKLTKDGLEDLGKVEGAIGALARAAQLGSPDSSSLPSSEPGPVGGP